jgi:LysR family tcuABC transcriptional regulator
LHYATAQTSIESLGLEDNPKTMELRQFRYFLKVVEQGSIGRAALELGVVTSALSQQITRLETELATRLLHRSSRGVVPTDAGVAFMRQAQLTLRHADSAALAARESRYSGQVSVGLAPSTATVLGPALFQAMRERFPSVRIHLVESLSGHLAAMLSSRQLDLAVLFQADAARRWNVTALLDERVFLFAPAALNAIPFGRQLRLREICDVPLILPSASHGLRMLISQAFSRARCQPRVIAEIDGLALLMAAVRAGQGATLQPGAAAALAGGSVVVRPIASVHMRRTNLIASLSDEELSPEAMATRLLIGEVARSLVQARAWPGASLPKN